MTAFHPTYHKPSEHTQVAESAFDTLYVHANIATMNAAFGCALDSKNNPDNTTTDVAAIPYGQLLDAAIATRAGKIAWIGSSETAKTLTAEQTFDLQGRWVTPALIDCHTHLVYGGNRSNEFEARLQGVSYSEIAQQGGGILSTVTATRAISAEQLYQQTEPRLRALIGGQLALVQEPGRPMTGNGQLDVREGSFSIYGKRVKIDSGRLLFSGGSLTNPGIEIRSENTEDNITAGMRVDGFLKSPRVNLYSRPYMDQGAIVSHLVEDTSSLGGSSRDDVGMVGDVAERLGMGGLVPYLEGIKQISMIDDIKLDTESDNTSLVFGSWLTPDFYVSYGKSLSGEGATFTTRYTLGKGFVVETESGETQSSGDIKYEFEH